MKLFVLGSLVAGLVAFLLLWLRPHPLPPTFDGLGPYDTRSGYTIYR